MGKIATENKIKALQILWHWGFHASEGHEKGELSDYMEMERADGRMKRKDAFQTQEYLRQEMNRISKRITKLNPRLSMVINPTLNPDKK